MAVCVSSVTSSSNLIFDRQAVASFYQCVPKLHVQYRIRVRSSESCAPCTSDVYRSDFLTGSSRIGAGKLSKLRCRHGSKIGCKLPRGVVNRGGLKSEKGGKRDAELGPDLGRTVEFPSDLWEGGGEFNNKRRIAAQEEVLANELPVEEFIVDGEFAADVEDVFPAGSGDGEEEFVADYWSRNGAGTSSETTVLYPNANQWVEDDLNKRIRYQNGREVFEERAYLIGIDRKGGGARSAFGIIESLEELAQLADTAGLSVVGTTYQKLDNPSPKTYIGAGKVSQVATAVKALKVETVVFDDELSPGQLRNLEKAFGDEVRVCDRTALILDIFSQRAATREATLQVDLAQLEYQLPRLTRMWTHLERQAGGLVKGMGEKQIEVDKRILRTQIGQLKRELDSVRGHRQQYRDRRASVPIPVVSLVGYTNAGKSTLLNRLSGAGVLAEDRLFATLDPTTRRVELPNGKECLFTDTVGFIQKLPTQLVAAFRATLEEISDSSLLLHVMDVSHPMAAQQREAVDNVLSELEVDHIPYLCVWNKFDRAEDPAALKLEAANRGNVVCMSALTGEGMEDFYDAVESKIKELMVQVEAVVPYGQGELVNLIHRLGIVELEEYTDRGTLVRAHVPLALSKQLMPLRHQPPV